jgi:hypothetical protein
MAESDDELDAMDHSPGVWTMLVVTASCVVALAGMVAWPSIDTSILALCVPVYWLGRTCLGAYRATRPDRPCLGQFLPALIGSLGVVLMSWSVVAGLGGAAGMVVRSFAR